MHIPVHIFQLKEVVDAVVDVLSLKRSVRAVIISIALLLPSSISI